MPKIKLKSGSDYKSINKMYYWEFIRKYKKIIFIIFFVFYNINTFAATIPLTISLLDRELYKIRDVFFIKSEKNISSVADIRLLNSLLEKNRIDNDEFHRLTSDLDRVLNSINNDTGLNYYKKLRVSYLKYLDKSGIVYNPWLRYIKSDIKELEKILIVETAVSSKYNKSRYFIDEISLFFVNYKIWLYEHRNIRYKDKILLKYFEKKVAKMLPVVYDKDWKTLSKYLSELMVFVNYFSGL